MTTTSRSQLFGIAGAIGGLLFFLLMWLSGENDSGAVESFMVVGALVPLLLALGVAALAQRVKPSGAAKLGVALAGIMAVSMTVGMGLMAWSGSDAGWPIWLFSLMGHVLGLLIFGISDWRQRGWTRFNAVPLMIGVVTVLGFGYSLWEELVLKLPWSQQSEVGLISIVVGLCLGWMVLGVLLAMGAELSLPANSPRAV
jgi:drug/metabolite transporter (DMT)-like permease